MIRAIIASTLVLGLAGLAAAIAHRASASVRHAIWLVGLSTALGVGALAALGPVFEVQSSLVNALRVARDGLPVAGVELAADDVPPAAIAASSAAATPSAPMTRYEPATRGLKPVALAVWALGIALILLRAIAGRAGVRRLIERSQHLDADLRLDVDASIDVRLSPDVDAPFTLGTWRPVIMLPLDAQYWTSERLRIVLVHEAAHVARLDYFAQLVGTATCATYWFNPIAWLAASRLRAEAEHAADDRVLAAGIDGVTYASHLLELARPASAPMSTAMAVGMANGTNRLERRFTAMLDTTRSRGIVPLRLQAAIGSAAMLVAVPFTSLRLVPVAPMAAPVVLAEPAPLPVVAPAALASASAVAPVLALTATKSAAAADTIIDKTVNASAGEGISIDLGRTGGGVVIHGWNQQQVRLHGVLSGAQARETEVTFGRGGRGVELRAYTEPRNGNYSNSNRYELWVPAKFDVQVKSSGGEILIDGVEGRFTGTTGGGEIRLDNVSGTVSLATGGGEVQLTNSNLEGSVSTGGGEATVTNTTGGVRVSSGSGPVIRTANGSTKVYGVGGLAPQSAAASRDPLIVVDGQIVSGGPVSYSRAGGSITLQSLPDGGTFTTGGGDIEIGSVGGKATFTTGGGDVHISNVADDISVSTGAGTVEISVIDGRSAARNISISSGSGRVIIELPASLNARLDVETDYTERHGPTKIDSDFPLKVTESDEWDSRNGTPRRKVIGLGSIGAGRGLIKIRTVNGDITIRRK
jgi:beta-lactamase regulating signal transducer with metallopeptidase domain